MRVSRYLEAIESNRPKRGRRRTEDSVKKGSPSSASISKSRGRVATTHAAPRAARSRSRARRNAGGFPRPFRGREGFRQGRRSPHSEKKGIAWATWRRVRRASRRVEESRDQPGVLTHAVCRISHVTATAGSASSIACSFAINSSASSRSPRHVTAFRQNIAAARPAGTWCSITRSIARAQSGGSSSSRGPRPQRRSPGGDDRGDRLLVSREQFEIGRVADRLLTPRMPGGRSTRAHAATADAGSGRCPSNSRVHNVGRKLHGCRRVRDDERGVGYPSGRLRDHRRRRVETSDVRAPRVSSGQQRRRVSRAAPQVEHVARCRSAAARRGTSESAPRRCRRRLRAARVRERSRRTRTWAARSPAGTVPRAAASSDSSSTTPSAEPISASKALGCGMSPTTLWPSLQIPAMSSRLPLGLRT